MLAFGLFGLVNYNRFLLFFIVIQVCALLFLYCDFVVIFCVDVFFILVD